MFYNVNFKGKSLWL